MFNEPGQHTDDNLVQDHIRRLERLEACVIDLGKAIATIQGNMGTVEMLLKWAVLPLLVIVAGLVGIKLIVP